MIRYFILFFSVTILPIYSEYVKSSFMGTSLIQMPSTEDVGKKNLDFVISHRFGNAKNTSEDFLGMDNGANTQLGFDYGLTNRFSIGFARTSADKTYEARTKYRLYKKGGKLPITFSFFGAVGQETSKQSVQTYPTYNIANTGFTALDANINNRYNNYQLNENDKKSFLASLLISARLNDRVSLQVSPMFVHRNFVKSALANDRSGLEIGGRIKLTRRIDILFESILTPKRDYQGENYNELDTASYGNLKTLTAAQINSSYNSPSGWSYVYMRNVYYDKPVPYTSIPISLGFDMETGGHIFQIFITNSRDIAHTWLLRGTEFNYSKKEWTIGFNIHRYFNFEEKNEQSVY